MCPVCLFSSAALLTAGTTSAGGGLVTFFAFLRKATRGPTSSNKSAATARPEVQSSKDRHAIRGRVTDRF
jgi:hypothetical protein